MPSIDELVKFNICFWFSTALPAGLALYFTNVWYPLYLNTNI